jgi:hypothetical protein
MTTGLSMQKMWDSWRPITPSTQEQLNSLIELETTVSEFTSLALQTRVELSQLSHVWESLVAAQRFILRDGADGDALIQSIKQTVAELGQAVRRSDSAQYPYFSEEFEALCQYHDISSDMDQSEAAIKSVVPLLAGRPARSLDSSASKSQVPELLQRIASYSGAAKESSSPLAIGGVLSLSLLERLATVGNTTLGQMDILQAEKQALSKALSLSSRQITMNQADNLKRVLAALTLQLVA